MWSKVGMGGEKHNNFRQNLRNSVDLTQNDPYYRVVMVEVTTIATQFHL